MTPTADTIQEAVRQLREAERLLLDALSYLGVIEEMLSDPTRRNPPEVV
ncbi:MAG: hypothetical protein A4E48_00085 [Methanosaeta sp. PtaU1.Bin060]|nr:MAG: hypothetical protein A4E48_00085 [Methanosaeta sp. PtaU1.Bin060]